MNTDSWGPPMSDQKLIKVQKVNKKIQSGLSILKYLKCVFTSKNVVDSYSTREELSFEV